MAGHRSKSRTAKRSPTQSRHVRPEKLEQAIILQQAFRLWEGFAHRAKRAACEARRAYCAQRNADKRARLKKIKADERAQREFERRNGPAVVLDVVNSLIARIEEEDCRLREAARVAEVARFKATSLRLAVQPKSNVCLGNLQPSHERFSSADNARTETYSSTMRGPFERLDDELSSAEKVRIILETRWRVRRRKGHLIFRRLAIMQDGTQKTQDISISKTPSDYRTWANICSQLMKREQGVCAVCLDL